MPRLLLLFAFIFPACADTTDPSAPDPLNILLITVDTVRADHLHAYGYPLETTPHLDELAQQGVRFEHPIAQRGATWPSLTSILTATYPSTHGVRRNGAELDASQQILSQVLRTAGYATAGFLTNMTTAPNRGFDTLELFPLGEADVDLRATRAAEVWLEADPPEPFFAWIHLFGPHADYAPRPDAARRFATGYEGDLDGAHATLKAIYDAQRELSQAEVAHIVSLYDAALYQTDQLVGRLLARIESLCLADRTLVVFTSDHGEELYQHRRYFLHTNSLYDSVLRVPLILRLPGRLPAGVVVDSVVETIDIAPTLLELASVAPPPTYEGSSLLPRIDSPASAGREGDEHAFSELSPHIYSLRSDRWHLLYNPHGYSSPRARTHDEGNQDWFKIGEREVYDLATDPGERHNVAAERPEIAAALEAALRRWIAAQGMASEREAPSELSSEAKAELRALGYLAEDESIVAEEERDADGSAGSGDTRPGP